MQKHKTVLNIGEVMSTFQTLDYWTYYARMLHYSYIQDAGRTNFWSVISSS